MDNNFTPRRWAELEEVVASRTQDMSKLELIGEPLLSDDESSEQTDSEGEISDSEYAVTVMTCNGVTKQVQ